MISDLSVVRKQASEQFFIKHSILRKQQAEVRESSVFDVVLKMAIVFGIELSEVREGHWGRPNGLAF